ncbi:MAG: polyprenyl synthetase family protein [Hydrogenophilaceae bacterium]|nr:polyprenyl synthetase family protein [Hydrogenophilaceae bacterium]
MTSFAAWAKNAQERTEAALARHLPAATLAPERLHEAMRYVSLGGGKRIRPMLAFAAGEAVGAVAGQVEPAAMAVELIHVYSLTHDDLPCMDDDDLRRGKPTCHVHYDQATALLVGDALQSLAFEILAAPGIHPDPATQVEMLHLLAHAAGSRGMCGGQAVDLASTGKQLELAGLEFMHIHKTGALIRAAVLLGALANGKLEQVARARLEHYAKCIGLAFQVMDDVLDAEASTATLGKTAGKDAAQGKATYLTLMSAKDARAYAQELVDDALTAAGHFGARGARLADIARFIVERSY